MDSFTFIVYDFNHLTSDDLWEWVDKQGICEITDISMEPDEVTVTPADPGSFDEETLTKLKEHFVWYFNLF